MIRRTAQNILEAERIAAVATMPAERLPKDKDGEYLYDPEVRYNIFLRLDAWTTKQSDKGIPFDRAPALVLMACREYDEPAIGDLRLYIRNLSNVLGTARDTQLCIDIHEFYRIGTPKPHPDTLMTLLAHQEGDEYPSYATWEATFTIEQRTQWKRALVQARAGTLKPQPKMSTTP